MTAPARPDDTTPEFGSAAYFDALRAATARIGARLQAMTAEEFRASLLELPVYAGHGAEGLASRGAALAALAGASTATNVVAPMERRYREPLEKGVARWRAVQSQRIADSMHAFAEAVAKPEHVMSPEELSSRLERDPERRVMLEHIRAMSAEVDDAVVPALRRLAVDYLRESRRPDAFFRGLTRVLSDLEADEYAALRLLLRSALDASDPAVDRIEVRQRENGSEHDEVGWLDRGGPDLEVRRFSIPRIPHLRRLMRLFKSNDLAEDSVGGSRDAFSGPDVISIERSMIALMSQYVNADEPA